MEHYRAPRREAENRPEAPVPKPNRRRSPKCRQRSEGVRVSLAGSLAAGFVSYALIEFVFFGGDAIDLLIPPRRFRAVEAKELGVAHPGTRVHLRIRDRHCQFQRVGIDAAIAFL